MATRIEEKPYCCVVDVVTRKLPITGAILYPQVRKRLLELMGADQQERRLEDFYSNNPQTIADIAERERARIKEISVLLKLIKTPSVRNIGLDGSRALWLIALHNTDYKNMGEIVLKKMKRLYYKDKHQVFYPGIPYLVDMVMLQRKNFDHAAKQLYGTRHWYVRLPDSTAQRGSFPVIASQKLGERRKKFGLPPKARKCRHFYE